MKLLKNSMLRNIFAAIGLLSCGLIAIVLTFFAYSITWGNRDKIDEATNSDVRFVLNWCQLGDEKIEKVLRSYVSKSGFTGDHHDAYLIKIKGFKYDDLEKAQPGKWYRGDQLPELLKEAVSFGMSFKQETPWFINESEILKDDCYVYPWFIGTDGLTPRSIQIIILKPKLSLVYYIDASI